MKLKSVFSVLLPLLGLVTLRIILKFTQLHILYWPEEIPLAIHEYIFLLSSFVFFIMAIWYKFKFSIVVSLISIFLSLINIVGFSVTAAFYLRDLYMDMFI